MIISFDADDVIWDYVGTLCKWHNAHFGTKLKREDFWTYRFAKILPSKFTKPEDILKDIHERVDNFNYSDEFLEMPIMPNARDVILKLGRKHDVIITTARNPNLHQTTIHQCKRDLDGIVKEILFSHNAYTGWGEKTKGQLCAEKRADVHIDDSPAYAEDCLKNRILYYLLDSPWNKEESSRAQRVYGWLDIAKRLVPERF